MRIAAAFLVTACLLCFATSDFAADHESALVEADFTEDVPAESTPSPVELLTMASRTSRTMATLANVVALKAYAVAARSKVQQLKLTSGVHGANAILWDFVLEFGKHAPPKAVKPGAAALNRFFFSSVPKKSKKTSIKNNVIMQYSQTMGKLKGKYTKGLGRYVLNHLEKAIMSSKKGVVTYYNAHHNLAWGKPKPMMMLNYKALAFDVMPKYLLKMAIGLKKYSGIQHDVTRASINAETKASAAWLHTGENQHYRDFIGQAIAKYKKTKKAEDHKVYEAALSGAQKSFKESVRTAKTKSVATNMKHVHVMAPGARNGADAAAEKSTFKFPTTKKLKAEASAAAAAWVNQTKAIKPGQQLKNLVKHLEKKAQARELAKRRAIKEKKAQLAKKKAFAARAAALRAKVLKAANTAWKKQHAATVKKSEQVRKKARAAYKHAMKVVNHPCVTLQSDTNGIVYCNKTTIKQPNYTNDVLPLFKKKLTSWAKKRAACKDTPNFINGNKHSALSLPAAGHGCAAYAALWCFNGQARPGQEWTLGKKYRYPEKHCCACGKRGLQKGKKGKKAHDSALKKAVKVGGKKAVKKAMHKALKKALAKVHIRKQLKKHLKSFKHKKHNKRINHHHKGAYQSRV